MSTKVHQNILIGGGFLCIGFFVVALGFTLTILIVLFLTIGAFSLDYYRKNQNRRIRLSSHAARTMRRRSEKEHHASNSSQWGNSSISDENRHSSLVQSAGGPLLSPSPSLSFSSFPRVRRINANNSSLELSSHNRSLRNTSMGGDSDRQKLYPTHLPRYSSLGMLPTVKLNKPSRPVLNERNARMLSSPVTVKIAPPDSYSVTSPIVTRMRVTSPQKKSPCDTQAVLSALREKRKRNARDEEGSPLVLPERGAKRRRQVPYEEEPIIMPSSLPNGVPGMHFTPTNTLKRPAEEDSSNITPESAIPPNKKILKQTPSRNNPILSSYSSSKRFLEKTASASVEKRQRQSSGASTPVGVRKKLHSNSASQSSSRRSSPSKSILEGESEEELCESNSVSNASTPLNSSRSSTPIIPSHKRSLMPLKDGPGRRRTPIYGGLTNNFKNVPKATFVPSFEDFEKDREADLERVKQMLSGFDEKKPEEDKSTKQSTAATTTSPSLTTSTASTVSTQLPKLCTPASSMTSSSTLTSTGLASTSAPSVVTSAAKTTSSNTVPSTTTTTESQSTQPFKSVFGVSGADTDKTNTAQVSSDSAKTSLNQILSGTAGVASSSLLSSGLNTQMTAAAKAPPVLNSAQSSSNPATSEPSFKHVFGGLLPSGTTTRASTASSAPLASTALPSFGLASSSSLMNKARAAPSTATGSQSSISSTFTFGASTAQSSNNNNAAGGLGPLASSSANATSQFAFGNTTATKPSLVSSQTGFNLAVTQSGIQEKAPTTQANVFGVASTRSLPSFGTSLTQSTTGAALGGPSQQAPSSLTSATKASGFGTAQTTLAGGFSAPSTQTTQANAFGVSSTPSTQGSIFGAPSTQTTKATGFSFGLSSGPATGSMPFGAPSTQTPSTFGTPASQTTQAGGFGIGSAQTTQASLFGGSINPTTQAGGFAFGSSVQTTAASAFGAPTAQKTLPNMFGAPSSQTTQSSIFGAPTAQTTQSSGFAFGTPTAQNTQASTFGTPTNQTTQASMFGAQLNQTTQASAFGKSAGQGGFSFTASTGGFGAPTAVTSQSTMFGSSTPQSSSSAFAFGQTTTQPAFPTANKAAVSTGFGSTFGSPAPQAASPFGATASVQSTPFGSSTSQQPFAASAATNAGFSFAASTTTKQPTGTTGNFNFGGSSSQTPAFGSGNLTTPAFGNSSTTTPAFGMSGPAPAFGTTTSAPAFGSPAAPAFGAGATAMPAFGSGGTPAFGAPTGFSIGSSGAQSGRQMARGRRRNVRK